MEQIKETRAEPPIHAPPPYGQGFAQPVPDWMFAPLLLVIS
jgi:hypothetical protein